MALEQTLSIIKPDAVAKGHVDEICRRLEESGLSIVDKQSLHLDEQKAEGFYAEHKGKPFFEDLIQKPPPCIPPTEPVRHSNACSVNGRARALS